MKDIRYAVFAATLGYFLLLLLCALLLLFLPGGHLLMAALALALGTAAYVYLYLRTLRPLLWLDDYCEGNAGENGRDARSIFLQSLDKRLQNKQDGKTTEYRAELLLKDAELTALESQINPHFLYNTLEAIRGYALAKEVPEIADITEALSQLFRNSIRHQGEDVTIRRELQSVECYLTIQQYRFPDKITYHEHIDDSAFDVMNYSIPNLIIQPLVENAIHHGIESKSGAGNVWLEIYPTRTRLVIRVKDDGVGIEEDKLRDILSALDSEGGEDLIQKYDAGIALSNINTRVKLQYGPDYGLSILSSLGYGTEFEISLPLSLPAGETDEK